MRYLMLFSLASCGIQVKVDPVKVQPVTVNHVIDINLEKVTAFCRADCIGALDPIKCTAECYDKFLNIFSLVTGK
jgi:hypothetical protein